MSAPDLSEPLRAALLASSAITSQLPSYLGSFPIFTRRPVPEGAPYPCIVISQDISVNDEDGIYDFRPALLRDIAIYHLNEPAENYRVVDALARDVRTLFHRQQPLTVPGWSVTDIRCTGPTDSRVEADKLTGRIVQVTVRAAKHR